MEDCIFCRIVREEIPADIVWQDEDVLAFRDLHPQAPVHVLLIPKKHISGLSSAGPADQTILGKLLSVAPQVASQQDIGDAFRSVINTGAGAGQSVFHLHLHILGGRSLGWPPG